MKNNLNTGIINSINLINVKFTKEKEKNIEKIKVIYKISNFINFQLFFDSKNGKKLIFLIK